VESSPRRCPLAHVPLYEPETGNRGMGLLAPRVKMIAPEILPFFHADNMTP